jgi:hypothetical protein
MVRRLSLLLCRAVFGLTTALSLALTGCGGGSDATAPDPEPGRHDPAPHPDPQPQPDAGVPGTYGLVLVNGSQAGGMVLLSNPTARRSVFFGSTRPLLSRSRRITRTS